MKNLTLLARHPIRYVSLALVALAPIIVNMFFFQALMAPIGLPLAIVVIVLWFVVAFANRPAFRGLFDQRVAA